MTDAVQTGLQWVLVGGPSGVNVNSTTGQVTWTPTVSQLGTSTITIRVLDVAGNTTNQSFNVTVFAGPTVTGVSTPAAAGSNFQVGQSLTINVTFSEAVNVTGAGLPQLTLNDGAVVNFTIGSGTNTLQFLYTVAAGESTADLDYASITALALNGATIKDSAGNAANLTLPATGTNGLATKDIVIGNPQILADLQVALTVGSSMRGELVVNAFWLHRPERDEQRPSGGAERRPVGHAPRRHDLRLAVAKQRPRLRAGCQRQRDQRHDLHARPRRFGDHHDRGQRQRQRERRRSAHQHGHRGRGHFRSQSAKQQRSASSYRHPGRASS